MITDAYKLGFDEAIEHLNSIISCPQCEAQRIQEKLLSHDERLQSTSYFQGISDACLDTLACPHECGKENAMSITKCPDCGGTVQFLGGGALCLDCEWDNLLPRGKKEIETHCF